MKLAVRLLLVGLIAALAASGLAAACSLQNREGPDVTCPDLECGRINACADGIIAQCADGVNVQYHVCSSSDDEVCEEDWQEEGWYRCTEYDTDCEGCRPERVEGCGFLATGGGGAGGSAAGGSGGSGGAAGGSGGTGGAAGGTGGATSSSG